MLNSVESELDSFINTSRSQRIQSTAINSPRISYYQPVMLEAQSELNFNTVEPLRSFSPDDLEKLKYKIDLDKQVAEKKQRRAREWETKIERDRKYVRNQPFGKHGNTTVINQHELEEILTKGRTSSPVLDMPQELPLNYSTSSQGSNGNNPYSSYQPTTYDNYPQYITYSSAQPKALSPRKSDTNADFQSFYGPSKSANGTTIQSVPSSATAHPVRGDAHDPFLLFDPNKEGQNVFNIIPQQDVYNPWGRPGAGAPLVYPPTGQKFTRYSGSLQDKLNATGQLGFSRRQYSGDIDVQKRDLELEQQRRKQEEREHRSSAGDTAEWISQLENTHYPLKLHLPTTRTTREYIGVRDPYEIQESRKLHNHLVQQAEERARLQQLNRRQNSIAEIQHTEVQNSWWGRSGGGAPTNTNRRHNVQRTFESPRQKWTTNHLGQLMASDDAPSSQAKSYENNYIFPKTNRYSNHKNYYEVPMNNRS